MLTADAVDEYVQIQLSQHFFWEYCLWYDAAFFAARPFLREVADKLQWVYEEYLQGRARSITISMPPRAGKSYIISLFCSWWMAKLPELGVMRNSSTADLYETLSADVMRIIDSDKFKLVFPEIRLSRTKRSVNKWNLETSKRIGYFGASPSGTCIGKGANLAIYDDLYRNVWDALNENINDKVLKWKIADHNSRKELNCPEIGIGTRWRKNDVIGVEIEKGNVDKEFKIAALHYFKKEEPEFELYPDGKTFCENVNKTEFYLKEKRDLDDFIFDAMYMQEPVELKGLLFPLSTLQKYNPAEMEKIFETAGIFRLGVIDPAKGGGDDYAFVIGYLVKDRVYVHDVIYNNNPSELNEEDTVEFIQRHRLNKVYFEGNSAWYLMGESIRRKLQIKKSNCSFRIGESIENKHTRILAQSQFIKNNFIFREDWERLPQYRKFMKNLTSYLVAGGNEHDDAPDATAELASFFRSHYKNLW